MGGAAGHMAHLHDNIWMTVADIKKFLMKVASAELEPFEKVDGQNIFFRWSNEGIMTARNGTDIKNGGMSEAQYRNKFAGHPAEKPFIQGFETIKKAMQKLSNDEAEKIFGVSNPGSYRFVNSEIMLPESENIIVYDGSYIVLHNLKEYAPQGPKGKMVEVDVFMHGEKEFDKIVEAISDVEKTKDKAEWQVFGPRFIELKKIVNHRSYKEAIAVFEKLGLKDEDKISDYIAQQLELKLQGLPENKRKTLIKRIIMVGEGYSTAELPNINALKKGLTKEEKSIVSSFGATVKAKKQIGLITVPIAKAISDFAIEVLRGLHSFFMTDGDAEVVRMRKVLVDSIAKLESYDGDDSGKYAELLQKQLDKLGGIENIASTVEGVIFEYPPGSKQLVKLTGSFAMANQIVGRAKRIPVAEKSINEGIRLMEKLLKEEKNQGFESVAIIPGAFKPPHLGHVAMVNHYSKLADKVIIYISNPKGEKSQRSINGFGNVTAPMSLQLWNILLGNLSNVEVKISETPSPVAIAYDSVMPANPAKDYAGTPYEVGTTVYLGVSSKGDDAKRFAYAKKAASKDIIVPDPLSNAAPASKLPQDFVRKLDSYDLKEELPSVLKSADPAEYSASDLRYLLGKASGDKAAKELASYYVGKDNIDKYMSVLGVITESNKYSLKNWLLL